MEVSCGEDHGPEGAVAPYMDGGVLWGRPRPGRGCSAIYGMFCPHYTTNLLLGPRCGDVFEVLLQLKAVSKLPVWSLYGYCTS